MLLMSELQTPIDRLSYDGDLTPVVERVCEAYGVGELEDATVVGIGYEDCNVIIKTDQSTFVAKMFAKTRTAEEISRYATIMQKVVEAGVNHPALLTTSSGEVIYTDSGIELVLMRFIKGRTYFELDQAPNDRERKAVLEQAAKIHGIDYRPPFLFDSWAIPNIRVMFEKVEQYIEPNDLPLVESAMVQYETVPVEDLPHAFVHGDFTKTNVIKGEDGEIYIIDFSVANWYPRIQELAVVAANLLYDKDNSTSLKDTCELVANEYSQFAPLTAEERRYLPAYALAGLAMEFMGAHQEKYLNGNDTDETAFWFTLGREGLRKALAQL